MGKPYRCPTLTYCSICGEDAGDTDVVLVRWRWENQPKGHVRAYCGDHNPTLAALDGAVIVLRPTRANLHAAPGVRQTGSRGSGCALILVQAGQKAGGRREAPTSARCSVIMPTMQVPPVRPSAGKSTSRPSVPARTENDT